MIRSDDTTKIGRHAFEVAGLGIAPFKFVGCYEKIAPKADPRMPNLPGAVCAYCGAGIMNCYEVVSGDKNRFVVGCDCIEKTGDAGLIRAYKKSPEYRAKMRAARQRADVRVQTAWDALMGDEATRAKLATFRVDLPHWQGGGSEDWVTYATRCWAMCGAAGRNRYLKAAKKLLSETNQ